MTSECKDYNKKQNRKQKKNKLDWELNKPMTA